jgi:hypothetical protein
MENQHRLIKGYRDLTPEEIGLMNDIKAKAEEVGALVERVAQLAETDKRWVAVGKTDLQKGFMALTRAVARPETF